MFASKNLGLSELFGRLSSLSQGDHLGARLVRGSVGGIVVKVGTAVLSFVTSVVLARVLGADGFGIYSYVYAWVLLMALPAEFGLSTLVVRETAKSAAVGNWPSLKAIWLWTSCAAACLAFGFAAMAGLVSWLFADMFSEMQVATFGWGLILVPLIALGHLRGAALRGLGRVVIGQLPDGIVRPLLLLALIACVALFKGENVSSPITAMGLQALAGGLAFVFGAALLLRARPAEMVAAERSSFKTREWIASALPLALMGGMLVLNQQVGILALGAFHSAQEVGVYKVVSQGALLITFGMQVVNAVVAPYFSKLHAKGDQHSLQRAVTAGAQLSLALALPVFVVCAVFGDVVLRFVFGDHFATGYVALVILSVGYFINVAMGLANLLLNMTGFERQTLHSVGLAFVANVVLTLALTPPMGMNGAALAAASSVVIWKIQLWAVVRRRLGIESAAIPFGRRRENVPR